MNVVFHLEEYYKLKHWNNWRGFNDFLFYFVKLDVSERHKCHLPWILRRLANVSPFFNSLINRLRITNYCLRSASSSLLKFTRFIQGNNIACRTNLDMIRNLQQLHMNKKSYTYKTLTFNSHWNFFWIKSVMWSE
jgi:hypothetical protein